MNFVMNVIWSCNYTISPFSHWVFTISPLHHYIIHSSHHFTIYLLRRFTISPWTFIFLVKFLVAIYPSPIFCVSLSRCLRISHTVLYKFYCENCALFSITSSQIYNKEKHEQVKIIILYKSAMELNIFLLGTAVPKIGHSQVGQAQVASMYVHVVSQ